MRTSFAAISIIAAGAAVGTALAFPSTASAATLAPSGPGTEQVNQQGRYEGIRPGLEAGGALGTGFSGTYGLGYEGRLGYTFPIGVYVGGQVQAFYGNNVNGNKAHATFFGAEVGYKLFPIRYINALEVRPYVFAGPAFISQVNQDAPFNVNSKTSFAIQPGALALYHLGPVFVGADFRFLATPSPFGVTLMGAIGAGF
jgi:hypothetical protein